MLPVNLRVSQSWIVNRPQLTRTSLRKPTTDRQSEGSDLLWAGTRFLTSTVPLPPWMITHLPVPESSQPGKCQLNYQWMSDCAGSLRLNLTVAEGYPSRNTETGGLLHDQFVKPPRSSKWYDVHTDKKDSASTTMCNWSTEPAKLNSTFSRVARRSLPSAPVSRTISQDTLRHWERAFREQSVMCNQAAGLSRCLTKVQDSMVTHLKTLHVDKAKGKAAERTQQAVEELEYLVTFNR